MIKYVLWNWKLVGVDVSMIFVILFMMKVGMNFIVNRFVVVKWICLFYIVKSQLKILIFVGMVISMVEIEKSVLVILLRFVVNMWCVYIMNFKKVIRMVVNIMEL